LNFVSDINTLSLTKNNKYGNSTISSVLFVY
jgi:hypothetical protein